MKKIVVAFLLFCILGCSSFAAEGTERTIKVNRSVTDEIYEFLNEKLRPERLYEIEEYGWELMGEGASDDDLGIISALINEITYENKDDKTIIRMVRYE